MKCFANHWGTIFLLQESFGNVYNYQHKKARAIKRSHPDDLSPTTDDDNEPQNNNSNRARKAKMHRAAAYRAAERRAANRKAEAQRNSKLDNSNNDVESPENDGETEIEDLPDTVRAAIEREEIGIPGEYAPSLTTITDVLQLVPSRVKVPSEDESQTQLSSWSQYKCLRGFGKV
jgi:hypothetical protein